MIRNPVGWFEIYVQNIARAQTFYESVLQVNLGRMIAPDAASWKCRVSRWAWIVQVRPARL